MPELPDITAYITALEPRILGQKLERVRLGSVFLLRTVDPPLSSVEGRTVTSLRRIGKRIAIGVEGDLWLVLHLMIAGRLHWKPAQAKIAGRNALAAFDFSTGSLDPYRSRQQAPRLALYRLRGEESLRAIDPGGIEIFSTGPRRLPRRALPGEPHPQARPHRSAPDQRRRQRLLRRNPPCRAALAYHPHHKLKPEDWQRLFDCTRSVMTLWMDRLVTEAKKKFPEKVTAFRPEMAVHGRFNQPCPRCGEKIQRIRYADNETNYCARCQTGGKVLADRSLSRLLGSDWPRTLDELEALKRK